MKVFVIVPLLYQEWCKYKESLLFSFNNIYSVFNEDCFFYLVIQDKEVDKFLLKDSELLGEFLNYEVLFTTVLNVSNARNLGIGKAKHLGFSHLLFHDSSITYSQEGCLFFKENLYSTCIPKLSIYFHSLPSLSRDVVVENNLSNDIKLKRVTPIQDGYLWSYIFRVSLIDNFFDVDIGPGENTRYKCGEDVLFLFLYLESSKMNMSKMSKRGVVYHPPRPGDYSKHLLYARGQGHLFRLLLNEDTHNRKMILYNMLLFWGNAIFRVITFRKNAVEIFRLRLEGFFDK